jgi:hypothetical protein
MRLDKSDRLTMADCRKRALVYLAKELPYAKSSSVGAAVWPNSELRAQGLGGAAARILHALKKDGLVRWSSDGSDWGWQITAEGRKALKEE